MARVFAAALIVMATLAFPSRASSISWSFGCITDNDPQNCMIGESQFRVDVIGGEANPFDTGSMIGEDQVLFVFSNLVGEPASITDVYFADGTLLALSVIYGSEGVAFTKPASPGDLPGYPGAFVTTEQFSADSVQPVPFNGVDASAERLGILFTLKPGNTYADAITAMQSGGLRIGIHAQAIGSTGNSESFINTTPIAPQEPVPEGAAWLLTSTGVALLWLGRFVRGARG